ncbi:hypothetical protein IJ818_06160 [bacterium]|nr:hypothetical protein [bacterium]
MASTMAVQTNKPSGGLCPHGLPPGACPICSGGMGTGSAKKADFSAKPGEMSWNECAAIGAMLRAQKLRAQQNEQAYQNRLLAVAKFETQMMAVTQKLAVIASQLAQTQNILAKPAQILFNKVLIPTTNFVKNIPANIMKFANNIMNKFTDIQDKLNAIFGELKNSIEKKVSDRLQDAKKKLFSLFGLYEPEKAEEEKEVDSSKRTFEARTFLHDVYNKITRTLQSYDDLKKKEKNEYDSTA